MCFVVDTTSGSRMKYTEFRDSIRKVLEGSLTGMTWKELKQSLDLPYERPCPQWVGRLEREIGLVRREKKANALIWRVVR